MSFSSVFFACSWKVYLLGTMYVCKVDSLRIWNSLHSFNLMHDIPISFLNLLFMSATKKIQTSRPNDGWQVLAETRNSIDLDLVSRIPPRSINGWTQSSPCYKQLIAYIDRCSFKVNGFHIYPMYLNLTCTHIFTHFQNLKFDMYYCS